MKKLTIAALATMIMTVLATNSAEAQRPRSGHQDGRGGQGQMMQRGGTAAGGLAIGMDDPSIAAQLEKTALDSGAAAGTAITYRVDVEGERAAASSRQAANDAVASSREAANDDAERARKAGPVAVIMTLVTASAGIWAGWWLSPGLPGQPETWILAGAGVGLMVAWLGLRWAQARS